MIILESTKILCSDEKMYRNISYNNRKKGVTLWTWDQNGNRVKLEIPFKPYIMLEQNVKKPFKSIYKTPLIKKEFETEYHRRKFVNESGVKRIFYNIPPEQQFLIDRYHDITDWMSFTKYDLRVFFIDIEVYSPEEFPTASEAKFPINLITIYDTLNDHYYTWGLLNNYIADKDNITYFQCITESDLLKSFLKFWRKNFPDILSGWNSDAFDIPYIVNRLISLFGEDAPNKLSPMDNIWSTEKLDRFNNPITEWNIDGISCIDYMKAYKKFSRNERESYSLDYISKYELNYGKENQEGMNLAKLSIENWDKYVEYNIQDVRLMVDLEKKLHYLELCRMIAYKGLTRFEKAIGTTNVVTGLYALEARKRDQYIPTFKYNKNNRKAPGGLVRPPKAGFRKDIVSFDAASLYPNTIITLNCSPETKIGNIHSDDTYTTIYTVRGKEFKLKNDDFKKWMIDKKISKSMNNTLFHQSEKGIIPSIIDSIYAERFKNKKIMNRLEKKLSKMNESYDEYFEIKRHIEELDVLQYTLKILMNSIYGTFGNNHSILYDLDISSSITLTGQYTNHKAEEAIDKYIEKKFNYKGKSLVYGDTDSCYISLTKLFKHLNISLLDNDGKISKEAMDIITQLGGEDEPKRGIITKFVNNWAKKELNSIDPRFEFKREIISDKGLFLDAKKRYIAHVINDEGVDCDKFKYVGVEIVSSTISIEIRDLMKHVIEEIVLSQDNKKSNESIRKMYESFCKLQPEMLGTRMSIKDLKKYERISKEFNIAKGTPRNSKASILHNEILKKNKLLKKYEKIQSGDKIKLLYVSKNKYGIEYIAFKNKFPKEFDLVPDYDKIYMKVIHPIFTRLYESIGWELSNPSKNFSCDLLSIFT